MLVLEVLERLLWLRRWVWKRLFKAKKVLVLTIDPAKRLANSLGLQEFGNEALQIDLSSLKESDRGAVGDDVGWTTCLP